MFERGLSLHMDLLILLGGVHALSLSALVLGKKSKATPDFILSLILFLAFLAFLCVYFAFGRGREGALLFLVHGNLLFAPLFFLYVASSTTHGFQMRRNLIHLLPFVAASMHFLFLLDQSSDSEITAIFGTNRLFDRPVLFNVFYVLDLVATPVYMMWSLRLLRDHRHRIAALFSDHDQIALSWLRQVVFVMTASWLLIEVPYLASWRFGWLSESVAFQLGFGLSTLLIFSIGFFGLRQAAIFSGYGADGGPATPSIRADASMAQPAGKKYERSGLSGEEAHEYARSIRELMEREKLHLNSALSNQDLAHASGLTTHNLSQVLNDAIGESFYDFVNGYRVDEFKERVEGGEAGNLTLLAVALDCGFSSKTSFNRIFKRHAHQTPSRFANSSKKAGTSPQVPQKRR